MTATTPNAKRRLKMTTLTLDEAAIAALVELAARDKHHPGNRSAVVRKLIMREWTKRQRLSTKESPEYFETWRIE